MQSFIHYIQQSIVELSKVTWPTRRGALKMSVAVVVFSVVLGVVIGLMDLMFTKALQAIILKG